MSERRMLLAIVNQFKFLPYSYTYLYHSLVPQTISGKNVRNKAKFTKIYGNSEVVNQLNSNGDFSNSDPSAYNVQEPAYESVSIANNKMTMTLLQNIGSGVVVYLYSNSTYYANHKYLVRVKVKSVVGNNGLRIGFANSQTWEYVEDSINEGQTKVVSGIVYFTSPNTYGATYIRLHGTLPSGNSIELSEFSCVDLTKQYPFDTPTTLTDNRVKNILAQGYIPHNTGEIKDMEIGEFSSGPYNLLNLDRIQGTLSGDSNTNIRLFEQDKYYVGLTQNNYYNPSKVSNVSYSSSSITLNGTGGYGIGLPIKVLSNTSYVIYYSNSGSGTNDVRVAWYDKDGNYLSASSNVPSETTITSPNNAYFGVAVLRPSGEQTYTNVGFTRLGTRTGYAPYKEPSTLSLPAPYKSSGVGTSKDSWEITSTSHVFTRNNFWIDLGTLTVASVNTTKKQIVISSFDGTPYVSTANDKANILSKDYYIATLNQMYNGYTSMDKAIAISTSGAKLWLNDSGFTGTTTSEAQTYLTGKTIKYQLATPQTITIPRKHLAVVRIRDISSWAIGSNGRCRSGDYFKNIIKHWSGYIDIVNTIYCSAFINSSPSNMESLSPNDLSISISGNGYTVEFYDKSCSTTQEYLDKYGDYYIFYETENEVADITDTFDIEAGGSVNGNLFSWVRNQLVENGNFESNTGWTSDSSNYLISISNNVCTATVDKVSSSGSIRTDKNVPVVNGHKYLVGATLTCSENTDNARLSLLNNALKDSPVIELTANVKKTFAGIINYDKDSGTAYFIVYGNRSVGLQMGSTLKVEKTFCIDLNIAFPNEDIPTDINDYRIQYILEHGYIPTDTSGTYTSETCEVLPNVDFKLKCK